MLYTIHGLSLYNIHSTGHPDSVYQGATLVTITSSICSVFGDRLGRDGSWSSRYGELYTPEVEMTELYLYRSDIGAGNKTQGICLF